MLGVDCVCLSDRFETDIISVRLGRPVSLEQLVTATQSSATDAAQRPPITAAAAAQHWKFLRIEGNPPPRIMCSP